MFDRVGLVALVLLALATVGIVATSAALRSAAEGLFISYDVATVGSSARGAAPYELWLGDRFANDIPGDDLVARRARAVELAYRSDRLREFAGVSALLALIAGLLGDSPPASSSLRRDNHQLEAKTTSNGTV